MPRPCVICDAISSLIHARLNEDFSKYIDITEAEDPVSWNCKVHEPVLQAANWSDNDNLIRRGRVSFRKNAGAPVIFVDNEMLHLVRRDNIPHHYGMGRVVSDPAWFDIDIIKGLLDNCKRNHGELCEFPFGNAAATAQLPRPSYLIDVQARCVVAGSQVPVGKPFLFLSYVRQESDAQKYLSLTMANLEALKQPGALDDTALEQLSPPYTIPATFRDAMRLAVLLDVDYLWIDRLCVPQDDDATRELENSKTAYIAAAAAFVVAECDGSNTSHGIRGIPGGSEPRYFQQKVYPFGDMEAFVRVGGFQRKSTASRRDTTHVYPLRMRSRAETAMARRVLYFETGTVRCECRSCPLWATSVEAVARDGRTEAEEHMWESCAHECSRERWGCPMGQSRWRDASDWIDEDWDGDGDGGDGPFNLPEVPWTTALAQPWPALRRYYAMLAEMSQLKPQEPGEDIFDAAAGLVTAFGRVFQGRMINGLPESYFDLALLWRIQASSVRNPKRPSWTWAGWKRDPDSEFPWRLLRAPETDGADHIVAKAYPLVEIIPVTKWSSSAPSQELTVRGPSELDSMRWHEAKEAFRDPHASLPSGWSRVEGRKLVILVKAGAPKGYDVTRTVEGSHEMPAGDNTAGGRPSFWYPVPVRDRDRIADEAARYIFATLEISRGGFFVHRTDWPSQSSDPLVENVTSGGARSTSGSQVLRDTNGRIAGVLDAHDPDHEGTFHGPETPARTGIELVAISRGQTPLMNAPYPECRTMPGYGDSRDSKWYEFYNVIWVKWRVDQDDAAAAPVKIAERRGIGRVFRNVWEASPKEMEDITLG